MANTPSKRWTVKDVLSMVRELTSTVDQRKVLTEQGRYFYNAALSEIVSLLNSSSDPAYFSSESIATSADLAFDSDNTVGGNISAISATNSTITMGGTLPAVGSILYLSYHDTSGVGKKGTVCRVTSQGVGLVNVSLISGTLADWAGGVYENVFMWIHKTMSVLSYHVIGLVYNLDRVVTITDSTYGQCVEVTIPEFYSIGRSDFQHKSYDNDIIWTMVGNYIFFRNGAKITAPGTKTIIYQRQPIYPTNYDDSEYPDLADKYIPLLVKRIYTYIILQKENDIPKNLAQEMQMDYSQIAAFAGAELSNRDKNRTQVDKK